MDLERRRLLSHGRDDLAKKVEWVSDTSGDGLGFDVLSFDESGRLGAVDRGQDDLDGQILPLLRHVQRGAVF